MSDELVISGRFYRQYPPGNFEGFSERELHLPRDETAVLVVDIYGLESPSNRPHSGMGAEYGDARAQEIIATAVRPALDAAREARLAVVYVANSAPRIALKHSAYWEQKWATQHVDKDDLYSEDTVDPRVSFWRLRCSKIHRAQPASPRRLLCTQTYAQWLFRHSSGHFAS